jgi:molybdopterin converting factor small subunit
MRISVKLYGRYKEITGTDKIQLHITDGITLQDVINTFIKKYPSIEKDKSRMIATKNKMYISFDTTLVEGDEITISPPIVSGG